MDNQGQSQSQKSQKHTARPSTVEGRLALVAHKRSLIDYHHDAQSSQCLKACIDVSRHSICVKFCACKQGRQQQASFVPAATGPVAVAGGRLLEP